MLRPTYAFCLATANAALKSTGRPLLRIVAVEEPRLPRFDTGKAARDLGLTEYFPVKKTAIDMADALCRLGIVKGGRAAGQGGGRKQD